MKNELRREFTPHINPNDCWVLVLSRISGKNYNDIRQEMIEKGYADDKGLHSKTSSEVLRPYGYNPVHLIMPRRRTLIKDVLNFFYDKEVIIASLNMERNLPHLSYAFEGVDYTTSEVDSSMEDPVLYIWVKGLKERRNNIFYNE